MKRKALIMAIVTTLLWSGSYILNKLAFQGGIGPLTLSGLRYLIASLFLFCIGSRKKQETSYKLPLYMIILLGVLGYAVAQGLQYIGQSYLTPTQSSLFLSVGNTMLVIIVDRIWLRENQTKGDLIKLLFLIAGITMYYYPWGDTELSVIGMAFMLLSSVGYALNMTLTRRIMVKKQADPKTLVAQTMLAGSVLMLAAGLITEGLPTITLRLVLILAYLSLASGALGFYLWTKSQKELTAFESSSINNLMLIEIALMDFIFFSRSFSAIQIIAILVVFVSILLIQRRKTPAKID
ncbi:MAG: DMT family transporter [Clostridiales bacterium]|nr:DMT family transporter [Clostridiales bacterium]